MGEGKPVGGDANPISNGQGVEDGKRGGVGDFGDQMPMNGAFIPMVASALIGPQGLLDGADKEVGSKWKQDDRTYGRQDCLEHRVGKVRKDVVTPEEDQREED